MAHLSTFQYPARLTSGEIRLLRVDSNNQGVLQCSFRTARLDDPDLRYYALSWCWGDPSEAEEDVIVDGLRLMVKRTVVQMLKDIHVLLSDSRVDHSAQWIWVDVVCINQADMPEKETQISQMHRIYSQTQRVLIWLGQASFGTDMIMTVLQWISHQGIISDQEKSEFPVPNEQELEDICQSRFDLSRDTLVRFFDSINKDESQIITRMGKIASDAELVRAFPDVIYHDHPIWRAWLTLASARWFGRVWTIQEFYLPARATFVQGDMHIDWRIVARTTRKGWEVQKDRAISSHKLKQLFNMSYRRVLNRMLGKERSDRMSRMGELRFSAIYILCIIKEDDARATVPHDYIYGIMGLIRPQFLELFPVTYDVDPDVLFEDVMRVACFDNAHTSVPVEFWDRYGCGPPSIDRPSWLPFLMGSPKSHMLNRTPPDLAKASWKFTPEMLKQAQGHITPSRLVVGVDGYELDRIESVACSPYRIPEDYTNVWRLDQDLHMIGLKEIFNSGRAVPDWLGRIDGMLSETTHGSDAEVLVVGRYRARHLFLRDLFPFHLFLHDSIDYLKDLYAKLWHFTTRDLVSSDPTAVAHAATAVYETELVGKPLYQQLHMCLLEKSDSTYCLTSSSKFGRCFSKSAQPGDLVCLIPGGEMLHLLRPMPGRDTFRRIAAAWFNGWSRGEAARLIKDGELRQRTFMIE